jgi:uncharacterized protein (DUF2384 family)
VRRNDARNVTASLHWWLMWRYIAATVQAMATGFAAEAAHIRAVGHLSTADIARATGADESTVRAWLNQTRSPSNERAERLVELSSIVERLVRVMNPTYVPVWLRKPNTLLANEKPIDLVATSDYRKVSKIVASLEDTAVS